MRALLGRLAGRAFNVLYGPAAPLYDLVSGLGFAGEWSRWQRTALRFLQAGPTLEIGPGTGDLLPVLASQGLAPHGLEPSPQMIAQMRRKARLRGLSLPPLVRGASEALPFRDACFGAVVATFPTSWVFHPAPWDEIARVLRPGGDVAIVLGGELAPHGVGRSIRAAAYRLLYDGGLARLPPPPATLLNLRWERGPTRHGQAVLLVGRKPE